jgi:single-stranded-DNA-specific exonuclease
MERALLEAADRAAQPQLEAGRRVILVAGEGWHVGIVGIVASRLVERYWRPVFVIGMDGATGKGSARSVPGIDIGAAVIAARREGLLVAGGGHAMAAGVTLERARMADFGTYLEDRVTELVGAPPEAAPLALDGNLTIAGANMILATEVERMAPFGAGNHEPRFCLTDARIVDRREANGGHLSCVLAGTSTGRIRAIAFRCRDTGLGRMLAGADGPLRLAGRLKVDRWGGQARPSFHIDDAAPD